MVLSKEGHPVDLHLQEDLIECLHHHHRAHNHNRQDLMDPLHPIADIQVPGVGLTKDQITTDTHR